MLPPYGTDEIAQVVFALLQACHIRVQVVAVAADDAARTWHVSARLGNGREVTTAYPYSARTGIHTPRELAEWFVQEVEDR